MKSEKQLELSELPWVARWAFWGVASSFALAAFSFFVINFWRLLDPAFAPIETLWFRGLLMLIWTPAAVGLVLGHITIIQYPYLSQVIQVNETVTKSARPVLWRVLGALLVILGLMMLTLLIQPESVVAVLVAGYMSITFIYCGYFLCVFDRQRHVTTATFLDITCKLGVVFLPFFLPALLIGYYRNKKFVRSIELKNNEPSE